MLHSLFYPVVSNSDAGIGVVHARAFLIERRDWPRGSARNRGIEARSRTLSAEDARRVRLIQLLAQGNFYVTIRQVLGCDSNYVSRWKGASR